MINSYKLLLAYLFLLNLILPVYTMERQWILKDSKNGRLCKLVGSAPAIIKKTEPTFHEKCIKVSFLLGEIIPDFGGYFYNKQLLPGLVFSAYIDQPLLLVKEHKTEELRALLQSDKNIDINQQEDYLGATLLMFAAALGFEDIVNLLCEFGADPLLETKEYHHVLNIPQTKDPKPHRNVFDVVKHVLNNKKNLIPEQIASYERIISRCRIQVKIRYGLPILNIGKGKSEKESNAIREVLKKVLLPILLGPEVSVPKPPQIPHGDKLPSTKNYPFLKKIMSPIVGKISIPFAIISLLALGYLWYWDSSEQKASTEELAQFISLPYNSKIMLRHTG